MIVGVVAGTIGSLVGLGGGIVVVPMMLSLGAYISAFDNVSPQVAVGTSLLVVIFTGLSSTLTYMKYKKVDYKSGLIFFIGSGPGGIIGAYVNKLFNTTSFSIWFGLFMILVSIILMLKDKLPQIKQKPGQIVEPGQLIGSVGSSGYGPPGTAGKFPPHLHYGLYKDNGRTEWSFDPYPHLKAWERAERKRK